MIRKQFLEAVSDLDLPGLSFTTEGQNRVPEYSGTLLHNWKEFCHAYQISYSKFMCMTNNGEDDITEVVQALTNTGAVVTSDNVAKVKGWSKARINDWVCRGLSPSVLMQLPELPRDCDADALGLCVAFAQFVTRLNKETKYELSFPVRTVGRVPCGYIVFDSLHVYTNTCTLMQSYGPKRGYYRHGGVQSFIAWWQDHVETTLRNKDTPMFRTNRGEVFQDYIAFQTFCREELNWAPRLSRIQRGSLDDVNLELTKRQAMRAVEHLNKADHGIQFEYSYVGDDGKTYCSVAGERAGELLNWKEEAELYGLSEITIDFLPIEECAQLVGRVYTSWTLIQGTYWSEVHREDQLAKRILQDVEDAIPNYVDNIKVAYAKSIEKQTNGITGYRLQKRGIVFLGATYPNFEELCRSHGKDPKDILASAKPGDSLELMLAQRVSNDRCGASEYLWDLVSRIAHYPEFRMLQLHTNSGLKRVSIRGTYIRTCDELLDYLGIRAELYNHKYFIAEPVQFLKLYRDVPLQFNHQYFTNYLDFARTTGLPDVLVYNLILEYGRANLLMALKRLALLQAKLNNVLNLYNNNWRELQKQTGPKYKDSEFNTLSKEIYEFFIWDKFYRDTDDWNASCAFQETVTPLGRWMKLNAIHGDLTQFYSEGIGKTPKLFISTGETISAEQYAKLTRCDMEDVLCICRTYKSLAGQILTQRHEQAIVDRINQVFRGARVSAKPNCQGQQEYALKRGADPEIILPLKSIVALLGLRDWCETVLHVQLA